MTVWGMLLCLSLSIVLGYRFLCLSPLLVRSSRCLAAVMFRYYDSNDHLLMEHDYSERSGRTVMTVMTPSWRGTTTPFQFGYDSHDHLPPRSTTPLSGTTPR
ncbi:hypothetical protein B0H11DRAFT_2231809 [Mycena galericulata]|nr:hypothetical protein B0H11DRAFT_2231809 [Mycena galericulata]